MNKRDEADREMMRFHAEYEALLDAEALGNQQDSEQVSDNPQKANIMAIISRIPVSSNTIN